MLKIKLKVNSLLTYFFFTLCFFSFNSIAGLITFETNAAGRTPQDNELILLSDQFIVDGVKVSFGFDSNSNGTLNKLAVFEQVSNSDKKKDSGFVNGTLDKRDTAATGYENILGDFFIRQRHAYKPFGIFTILYDSVLPVSAASGEIWDIDGGKNTEQFLVKAYNADTLLNSILSPLGTNKALDGKPWTFGFSGLTDITKIEISFVGSKNNGIGLAFNNFSPVQDKRSLSVSSIPEPNSAILILLALAFLLVKKRK